MSVSDRPVVSSRVADEATGWRSVSVRCLSEKCQRGLLGCRLSDLRPDDHLL
jgi:hypothetical protein